MPTPEEILTFADDDPPPGADPWVDGVGPRQEVTVVAPDPWWPTRFEEIAELVREALGDRVLQLDHVGSTAVPGLAAKPIIDLDLILARPEDEATYVPALAAVGFELRVREPWWYQHRCLMLADGNLHVFGPEAPEPWRHRILRDHLRRDAADRDLYAAAKREATAAATAAGEDVMAYNTRKQDVIRSIYSRAFIAAGLS